MNLTKYVKGALIGAILSTSCNAASKTDVANISLGANYEPSTITERSVSDISPIMTVQSEDKLKTDKLSLEGKIKANFDENLIMNVEDSLIRQNGNLTRDSHVFDVIEVSEKGTYSKLTNSLKLLLGIENLEIGVNYLNENEKRNYNQHTQYQDNQIKTEQSSELVGPIARIPINHQGRINFRFNSDLTYFLNGTETYNLALEKKLPGDSKFEKRRKVNSLLSETSIELGIPIDNLIYELGIKGKIDYLSKNVKQNSTTEKYMPIYEDYKEARLNYALEAFVSLGKYVRLNLGVGQKQHQSKGSLEIENETQTRYYGGAEIRFNFGDGEEIINE